MARLFLLCLSFLSSAAYAGALEKCQQTEKEASSLRICIEAERNRAANKLRAMNPVAMKAIEKIAKDTDDRALPRKFSAQQAQHVRNRKSLCGQKPTPNEKVACEADMDTAHAELLARHTKP